jgi:hypothetical protein
MMPVLLLPSLIKETLCHTNKGETFFHKVETAEMIPRRFNGIQKYLAGNGWDDRLVLFVVYMFCLLK